MVDKKFFHIHGPFSLNYISEKINADLVFSDNVKFSNDEILVHGINSIEEVKPKELAILNNNKYQNFLASYQGAACIIDRKFDHNKYPNVNYLICDDAKYASSILTKLFYSEKKSTRSENLVHPSAKIGRDCYIGHNVVTEENVEIGDNCYIDHNSVIKYGTKIGNNANIASNVSIAFSILGNNVTILSGAKIGNEGFGFATYQGKHYKIFHTGRVVIGDKVEIGANSTIDRGSNGCDTIIGDNVMIDNLVQIAHNVEIGKGSIIVAQVGLAGSTKLGYYCVLGGQVGVAGHLKIGNFVQIAAQSGVVRDINDKQKFGGTPAVPIFEWHKQNITLNKLINK